MSKAHRDNNLSGEKMLVTFFLFTYNQERYIEAACMAALAQTYSPLEIIFSDDCSSDRTFDLINECVKNYNGPHKVVINRNKVNLGLINHVNKSFEISLGELIVVAAGDDISLPNRAECLAAEYLKSGKQALVLHSEAAKIDDQNNYLGIFIPPVVSQPMSRIQLADCSSIYIGATAAWSNVLYKYFGEIKFVDAYEDLVLGYRAEFTNSLLYVDKPLVEYRVGVGIIGKTKLKYPLWQVSPRVAIRLKKLKMMLDVYEQRLKDIGCAKQWDEDGVLSERLQKNINFQKKRILFYKNPLALLKFVFSKDFLVVLRSINSEVKHLIGLNK